MVDVSEANDHAFRPSQLQTGKIVARLLSVFPAMCFATASVATAKRLDQGKHPTGFMKPSA